MKRIAALFIVAAIAPAFTAAAQGRDAAETLLADVRAYAKSEIVPRLTVWKQRLDGAMTPADLTKLNELRDEATTLKKAFVREIAAMRQAWQAEDYATLKTSRNALRGMKEQRDALVARVVPLAKTYREVLIDLGEESQSYVEQWRKHGREMLADWQRQHPDADIPPRLLWGAMKQWGIRKAGKKAAAIRFMLWDGSGDLGEAQPKAGEFNPLTPDDDAPELTAAPNPFADGTHIRLTLPADQTITLAVYDGAGRRLAVLAEGFFTKGDHSFPYRADASGGQYARLDAGGATRTIALNTTK